MVSNSILRNFQQPWFGAPTRTPWISFTNSVHSSSFCVLLPLAACTYDTFRRLSSSYKSPTLPQYAESWKHLRIYISPEWPLANDHLVSKYKVQLPGLNLEKFYRSLSLQSSPDKSRWSYPPWGLTWNHTLPLVLTCRTCHFLTILNS